MLTALRTSRKLQVVSVAAAANMLGVFLPSSSALADNLTREQVDETGSKSTEISAGSTDRTKRPIRKPVRKPDRSGNFIYEVLDNIRTQSEEHCTRYGSPGDCLEEAEVCLTMRDTEDNQVRLCLNTIPKEGRG